MNRSVFRNSKKSKTFLTILFAVISIIYILPIVTVLINSFKANAYINTETFALPTEESYVGLDNYIKGMNYGNYPFFKAVGYSLVITIFSTALILICTSMAAWYITRVNSRFCKLVYLMCVFSMVVPFQMVMFTLAKTADSVHRPGRLYARLQLRRNKHEQRHRQHRPQCLRCLRQLRKGLPPQRHKDNPRGDEGPCALPQ